MTLTIAKVQLLSIYRDTPEQRVELLCESIKLSMDKTRHRSQCNAGGDDVGRFCRMTLSSICHTDTKQVVVHTCFDTQSQVNHKASHARL